MQDTPGAIVELESPPVAQNGEILELRLEDGRVLQIQVRGVSPYCRILGEWSTLERRRPDRDAALSSGIDHARRRSDGRHVVAIHYPCPRCLATDALVTHRGVMVTTLYCTACGHGWGEPPAVVAAAARTDRRAIERVGSADRRSPDRLAPPSCAYCATDAYVRSVRRSGDEVYFACDGCDAMWAVSRPHSRGQPGSLESR
jgi:Zn ribbon nucleic-acid-binding protein